MQKKYIILLIFMLVVSFIFLYFFSLFSYASLVNIQSQSACADFMHGNPYTQIQLEKVLITFIAVAIVIIGVLQIGVYFLLKKIEKSYKYFSFILTFIFALVMFFSIYEGKKDGLQRITQCNEMFNVLKVR